MKLLTILLSYVVKCKLSGWSSWDYGNQWLMMWPRIVHNCPGTLIICLLLFPESWIFLYTFLFLFFSNFQSSLLLLLHRFCYSEVCLGFCLAMLILVWDESTLMRQVVKCIWLTDAIMSIRACFYVCRLLEFLVVSRYTTVYLIYGGINYIRSNKWNTPVI